MPEFDVEALRARFPALSIEQDGRPVALFDGPGGTQVPTPVIEAVSRYYRESNANHDGAFLTSQRSDAILDDAHAALADLLNAADPSEIKFGANMTTLTMHVARSIAATLAPGDEIVVTEPRPRGERRARGAAPPRDRGLAVRTVDIRPGRRARSTSRPSTPSSTGGRSSSRSAGRRTPWARSTRSPSSSGGPTRRAP